MTTHIQQPAGSKLCGQCCVAMALGISLDEAVKLVGLKTRGTSNKQLVAALETITVHRTFYRGARSVLAENAIRVIPRALIRIRWERSPSTSRRFHVVLKDGDEVFDPLYSKPAPSLDAWLNHMALESAKVMGWLPLREPMQNVVSARVLGGAAR